LKSAGATFWNHIAECMNHLGWKPFCADSYLWMNDETLPDDGILYWEYILIYVDGIWCVHYHHGTPIDKLDEYYNMK
jgi:hypothetical protein